MEEGTDREFGMDTDFIYKVGLGNNPLKIPRNNCTLLEHLSI